MRKPDDPTLKSREIFASFDLDGQGCGTIDRRPLIRLFEQPYNLYSQADAPSSTAPIPIHDKWVYIFRLGAQKPELWVSAHTVDGTAWDHWDHCAPQTKTCHSVGGIELDLSSMKGDGAFFFLSPVQLTPGALDLLAQNRQGTWESLFFPLCGISFNQSQQDITLADPTSWAADIAFHEVHPDLKAWYAFFEDKDKQGRYFVASVLNRWAEDNTVDSDEWFSLQDLEDDEPASTLRKLEHEKKSLQVRLDTGTKTLIAVLESNALRAIERACMENHEKNPSDKASIDLAFQLWASVSPVLGHSSPGRSLIDRLLGEQDRFICRYLLVEGGGGGKTRFNLTRDTLKVAESLFTDLVPVLIEKLRRPVQGVPLSREQVLEKVVAYLEHLKIEHNLKGSYAMFYENLKRQQPPLWVPDGKKAKNVNYAKSYKKLEKKALFADQQAGSNASAPQAPGVLHGNFRRNLKGVFTCTTGVLEVINLKLVIDDFVDAQTPQEQAEKLWSLSGGVLEVSKYLTQRVEARILNEGLKRTMATAGSVMSLATSIIDGIQAMNDMQSAFDQMNDGKAVGGEIEYIGSAISFVGAGMCVTELLALGSVSGPGIIVAAIGGLIVLIGKFIVAMTERNPYEEFAAYSELGVAHDASKPLVPAWGPHALPCKTVGEEVESLVALLSHFLVECTFRDSALLVSILPGYAQYEAAFELCVTLQWPLAPEQMARYVPLKSQLQLEYDMGAGTHRVTDAKGAEVWVDSHRTISTDGIVRRIDFKLTLVELPEETYGSGAMLVLGPETIGRSFGVWARLRQGPKTSIPLAGKWLKLERTAKVLINHHGAGVVVPEASLTATTFERDLLVGSSFG